MVQTLQTANRNLYGKICQSQSLHAIKEQQVNKFEINVSNLNDGFYLVNIWDALNGKFYNKLTIIKN